MKTKTGARSATAIVVRRQHIAEHLLQALRQGESFPIQFVCDLGPKGHDPYERWLSEQLDHIQHTCDAAALSDETFTIAQQKLFGNEALYTIDRELS